MKNRILVGIIGIILGLLTAFGPQFIFRICDQHGHGDVTTCYWVGQAAIGIGAVLVLLSVIYLFSKNSGVRAGLSIAAILNGLLLFSIANFLIGVCEHAGMACRLATLPALNIISILTVVLAAANLYYTLRLLGKEDSENEPVASERT